MTLPTDAGAAAGMNGDGTVRWRALFGWAWAVTGLLGTAADAAAATSIVTSGSNYQSARSAPAAWQAFARQLQGRLQERLAAEDDLAQRFQQALAERATHVSTPADALTVLAWILPNGQIDRVEFEQLDPVVAARLRVLLNTADVGAPPADMLQPVHVRLLLRQKDQPGQGQQQGRQ
jgi:hypothetical protein